MKQDQGLTSDEAVQRFHQYGPNELVPSLIASRLEDLKRIFLDPMGLMLLGLSVLYAALGYRSDSITLLIAYVPITLVDVLLHFKANRALKALQSTLKPTAKVFRDGIIVEIPVRKIVPGDCIVFEEGQTLPADGEVLDAHFLTMNEASLTGESLPVEKGKNSKFYGGTVILQGRGLGVIQSTGRETRFGRVSHLLKETVSEETPLQKSIHRIFRKVLWIALLLSILIFLIQFWRKGEVIQGMIVALTFAMSAVPEEFPLVFTLFLSLGAWRLSRHGVLVKSLPSVETLGSVDVICTDKTGTLTEGKFQLVDLFPSNSLNEPGLMETASLMACEVHPVDSMELAIVERLKSNLHLLDGWNLKFDFPFEPLGKHMSHVWESKPTGQMRMAMKGAVEGVLEHCEMNSETRVDLLNQVESLAGKGKRILGLAFREGSFSGNRIQDETRLRFLGLLIFDDPIRTSVKDAIQTCQEAKIRIKMLTGDHPLTAHAVAERLGIEHSPEQLYLGSQLSEMSVDQRSKAYEDGVVFARVLPEQKHEMVKVLKDAGNIVAMTGDGINDAPALKLADIGISMGESATDVARSSARMILLKNDFRGIVESVFEGRRIFANLRRSFSYLISFHFPVFLLALIPPLLGWGDLLLPIHIVLLELLVHPISAITFENLDLPVSNQETGLMSRRRFFESALSGVFLSLFSLYLFYTHLSYGVEQARSIALSVVLLGNIFFIWTEIMSLSNIRFWITTVVLLFLTGILFRVKTITSFFHFESVSFQELLMSFGLSLVSCLPTWMIRLFVYRNKIVKK